MPNVRAINKNKYNISKYRFRELYYFCLQYDEWKEKIEQICNPIKGMQYSEMPSSGNPGDPTMHIAIECADISKKIIAIETAAQAADPELYKFIIMAVTNENVTFNFLKMQKNIPCERDRFYNSRRKFYFILDRILQSKNIETIGG